MGAKIIIKVFNSFRRVSLRQPFCFRGQMDDNNIAGMTGKKNASQTALDKDSRLVVMMTGMRTAAALRHILWSEARL